MSSGTGSATGGTKDFAFAIAASNLKSSVFGLNLKGSAFVAAAAEKTNSVDPILRAGVCLPAPFVGWKGAAFGCGVKGC